MGVDMPKMISREPSGDLVRLQRIMDVMAAWQGDR